MANLFKQLWEGLRIKPRSSTAASEKGDLEVIESTGKLSFHNGTSVSPVVTEAHTATLTNKTIDADNNTVSNIANDEIKANAAIDATKIADGSVSSTEFQYLSGVTSDIQTQINDANGDIGDVASDLNDHIVDATAAHAASAISLTPVGGVAANNVQSAIQELDSEKANASHIHAASDINSGTLATARGGTNLDTSSSTGIASVSSGTWSIISKIPESQGGTNQSTYAKGDILYASDTNTLSKLTKGNSGDVLKMGVSDVPQWDSVGSVAFPAGIIVPFGGSSPPSGWLLCDGSAVSRSTYSDLFTAIGTAHGSGDDSTTFNLPDYRGRFLRGVAYGASNDPNNSTRAPINSSTFTVGSGATTNGSSTITVASTANLAVGMSVTGTGIPASSVVRVILSSTTFTLGNRANSANVNATATNSGLTFTFEKSARGNYVGSIQSDEYAQHHHAMYEQGPVTNPRVQVGSGGNQPYANSGTHIGNVANSGGSETRPKNAYVNYIIKY